MGTRTDSIIDAIRAELEDQRAGIDGVKDLRSLDVSVKLVPGPNAQVRAVVVRLEAERTYRNERPGT